MHYKVFGSPMPAVTITMDQGENIYTQSGGMTWMTDGISMETNMKGGFLKGIGRMFAGESLFYGDLHRAEAGGGDYLSIKLSGGNQTS